MPLFGLLFVDISPLPSLIRQMVRTKVTTNTLVECTGGEMKPMVQSAPMEAISVEKY